MEIMHCTAEPPSACPWHGTIMDLDEDGLPVCSPCDEEEAEEREADRGTNAQREAS